MKNVLQRTLLTVFGIMLFFSCAVFADETYTSRDGQFEYELFTDYSDTGSSTVARLTNYIGESRNVVVPSLVDGYVVRELYNTFYKKSLSHITFPDTIKRFERAFMECDIEEIELPKGKYDLTLAFYECKAIRRIVINGDVEDVFRAFDGCDNLTSIVFNGNVVQAVFVESKNLKEAVFNKNVMTMTFSKCTQLETVSISDQVNWISDESFEYCYNLKSINFGGSACQWKQIYHVNKNVTKIWLSDVTINYAKGSEHKFGPDEIVEKATCLRDGVSLKKCEYCDESIETRIPALGHDYKDYEVVQDPGCEKDGVMVKKCQRCGEETMEEIPSTGNHSYAGWQVIRKATCTVDGIKEKKCQNCGKVITETIPSTGNHIYSVWKNVKEPTFKSTGIQERVCMECGRLETKTIKKLVLKAGLTFEDSASGCKYKVLSSKNKVSCIAPLNKNVMVVSIPDTIIYNGVKFKVDTIDNKAFAKCKNLYVVNIGKNISSIGTYAFSGCGMLCRLYVRSNVLSKVGGHALDGTDSDLIIRIPKAYFNKYKKIFSSKGQSKDAKIQSVA